MGEFSSSSSSEGDGDSEWKAAINSAAAGASSVMSSFMNGFSANENGGGGGGGGGDYNQSKTQQLPKHYQIKVSLPNQSPNYMHFVFHIFQFNGFVVSL